MTDDLDAALAAHPADQEAAADRLRALATAATPGPWRTGFSVDRDPEEYAAECVRLSIEYAAANGLPEPVNLHMVYTGEWDNQQTPGGIITAMTGNGPTSEANARYIAALSPAVALAIADLIEAGETHYKVCAAASDCYCWLCGEEWPCPAAKALAHLEELLP